MRLLREPGLMSPAAACQHPASCPARLLVVPGLVGAGLAPPGVNPCIIVSRGAFSNTSTNFLRDNISRPKVQNYNSK
jgi:hypothetical protein